MCEQSATKIEFLKEVQTNYIDQKKIDFLDTLSVKVNENDDRIVECQPMNIRGKIHHDVIPIVY